MKYKLKGVLALFITCVIVIMALLIVNTNKTNKRYLQHQEASREIYNYEIAGNNFESHLPIVEIFVDETIPGKIITDTKTGNSSLVLSNEGKDRIDGKIVINDRGNKQESKMSIHVRGNSSRRFDKSSYFVNLINDDRENNALDLLDMGEHHEWVLYGPILDKTLIRNYMFYNLAGQIMDYAPEIKFCEAFINNEHQGIYLLCESVTAGENRINISVNKKDNTFSGYILRLDRGSESEYKNLDNFSHYSYQVKSVIDCVYPGLSNLNDRLKKSITDDFSYFEKCLYSYDYNDDKYGYRTMIDVDSFVNYFIINELAGNYDAGAFSTYIYRDLDGKFKLCVWDFNNSCDNYMEQKIDYKGFGLVHRSWFVMLSKDEYFIEKVIARYKELRENILSEENLMNFIDDTVEYLGDSIDRNYEIWGYSFDSHDLNNVLLPFDRNPNNYEEAISDLKMFLIRRGRWMDENIDSLRQYCANSATKKFDLNTD